MQGVSALDLGTQSCLVREVTVAFFLPLAGDKALGTVTDDLVSTGNILDRINTTKSGEEDGEGAKSQTDGRPAVLDNEVLKHVVGDTDLVDRVDMTDQTLVGSRQDGVLQLCTIVEGDFLGVGDQTRVGRSEISLELGLHRSQFAERGGDHAEQEGRDNIRNKESSHARDTDRSHQLVVEDDGVQQWLAQVGVQSSEGVAELGNISGNVLIHALDAIIQVQGLVVSDLVVQVQVVDIACETGAESNGQLGLQVTNL